MSADQEWEEPALRLARAQVEIERLTDALHQIKVWSEAYPLDVFPEPDLIKARLALEAAGMTLDDISAHAMRHAIAGVGRIASDALATPLVLK